VPVLVGAGGRGLPSALGLGGWRVRPRLGWRRGSGPRSAVRPDPP